MHTTERDVLKLKIEKKEIETTKIRIPVFFLAFEIIIDEIRFSIIIETNTNKTEKHAQYIATL